MLNYRLIEAIGAAVIVTIGFYLKQKQTPDFSEGKREGRKTTVYSPLLLPFFIGLSLILVLINQGGSFSRSVILKKIVPILVVIVIYYTILVILSPILRRFFRPTLYTTLWLLPNLLYIMFYSPSFYEPYIFLPFPMVWLNTVGLVWLGGFGIALGWQVLQHVAYRHRLLQSAQPVQDEFVNARWIEALTSHDVKVDIPIVISDQVQSPVTIGLFDSSMRLVLPNLSYTQSELDLIFLHEANHILRADSLLKFMIGFCTALTWFNPLSWLARSKVSQDIELSNDFEVLKQATPEMRKEYANLILNSADCSKGFTTCLSASAQSLRYRLKQIIAPRKRLAGYLLIGLATFLLVQSVNLVSLADTQRNTSDILLEFQSSNPGMINLNVSNWNETHTGYTDLFGYDEAAIYQMIGTIPVREIPYSSNYILNRENSPEMMIIFEPNELDKRLVATLQNKYLLLRYAGENSGRAFLVQQSIDWAKFDGMLDFTATDPTPIPDPPTLTIEHADNPDLEYLRVLPYIGTAIRSDGSEVDTVVHPTVEVNGVDDFTLSEVGFFFDLPIADGVDIYYAYGPTAPGQLLKENVRFNQDIQLREEDAYYRVVGTFDTGRDVLYDVEYRFYINRPKK